jgi:hypothetical protein
MVRLLIWEPPSQFVPKKKKHQGFNLWRLMGFYRGTGDTDKIQQLLQLAHVPEEHTETGLSLYKIPYGTQSASIDKVIQYYLSPCLHDKQVKYSKVSLEAQLLSFAIFSEEQENPYCFLPSTDSEPIMTTNPINPQKSQQETQPTTPPK